MKKIFWLITGVFLTAFSLWCVGCPQLDWKMASIVNKKECVQDYELPLMICDSTSPLSPIVDKFIQDSNKVEEIKTRAGKISANRRKIISIRFLDNHLESALFFLVLNGEHERMANSSNQKYAGVFVRDNKYFVVTEAVADLLVPFQPDSILKIQRVYTEYDFDNSRNLKVHKEGFSEIYF